MKPRSFHWSRPAGLGMAWLIAATCTTASVAKAADEDGMDDAPAPQLQMTWKLGRDAQSQAASAPAPESSASQGAQPTADAQSSLNNHDRGGDQLRSIPYERTRFGSDPIYPADYATAAQWAIYGGKQKIENSPRPLFEFGYPQYEAGPLPPARNWFGAKNLARPQFMVFGDWRTAVAANDAGGDRIGQLATRLNLDFDLALTSTGRLHWSMRPLDQDGRFTRYQFSDQKPGANNGFTSELNGHLKTMFFEGDLSAITAGITGRDQHWDLPFVVGFMPLFVQNGIWMNAAVTGGAFAIPARSSPLFDISNMDITFFGAGGLVSSPAIRQASGQLDQNAGQVFGVTMFAEMLTGYLEAGYGYTNDTRHFAGGGDFSYHNLTLAFTRRYAGLISNSVRLIGNFGQKPPPGAAHTADGYLVLVENSFITRHELTLVPYLNLWYGQHHPQSLLRAADAGGVLANTGIDFQTDGLTGFPNLDASAQDTYGGALGIEYLFSLDRQVVAEVSGVFPHGDDSAKRPAQGDQYAVGLRFQQNLGKAWILRSDYTYGIRGGGQPDFNGVRLEIRRKF
jgi:hypothetical protein